MVNLKLIRGCQNVDKFFERIEAPITTLMDLCVEAKLTDELDEACEDLALALKIPGRSQQVMEQKLDAGMAFYEELVQVMYDIEGLESIPEDFNFDMKSVVSLMTEVTESLQDELKNTRMKLPE